MTFLDRDKILASKTLKRETVDVPEWGGSVLVRELTGAERSRYEAGFSDQVMGELNGSIGERAKRYEDMRARIVVLAAIHEDGKRIFTDADTVALNDLSGEALDRIFSVVMRLSGYTKDEQERIKKNLTADENSTSALH